MIKNWIQYLKGKKKHLFDNWNLFPNFYDSFGRIGNTAIRSFIYLILYALPVMSLFCHSLKGNNSVCKSQTIKKRKKKHLKTINSFEKVNEWKGVKEINVVWVGQRQNVSELWRGGRLCVAPALLSCRLGGRAIWRRLWC